MVIVICSAYASQVADPFSPKSLAWFWWAQMVICHLLGLRLASGRPIFAQITCVILVGSNGLEPSTSRLSGVCSNQLSYEPIFLNLLRFWWRQAGSNRWPPACRAGALPAELCPHYSFINKAVYGKYDSCVVPTVYKTNAPKQKVRSTKY